MAAVSELALNGGTPVAGARELQPSWPIYDDSELRLLGDVLRNPTWGATGLGPKIDEFNEAWAGYSGTRRSVLLANGTVTLELALRALGVGPGDEVIVPAWTFMATAVAVLQVGATPVFIDVDPRHLCLNPDATANAVTTSTRAIVPVHLAGHPCDMDALTALAARHGLVIIEDAAQAHGATWRGRSVGSFGECGSFSFQQSKNLQCGEGGSVVTDDAELADRLHYSLSKFGRGLRDAYAPFAHYELAGNASATEWQAAILLAQLARLEDQAARRAQCRRRLAEDLDGTEGVTPVPVDPRVTRHGCHLFLFRYDADAFAGLERDRFATALAAEGVPCFSLYPRPLFQEPIYDLDRLVVRGTQLRIKIQPCPESERAAREVLALPQTLLLAGESAMPLVRIAIEKVRRGAAGLAAGGRG